MPPRVITVTLNPALDITVQLDILTTGKNIPARNIAFYPGGKGINVAKSLASLGLPCHCLGFIGADNRAFWRRLNSPPIELDLLEIPGSTRTNLTIVEQQTGSVRHIVSAGCPVTEGDLERLSEQIRHQANPGDWLLFCGSLPPGAPTDSYAQLIGLARQLGCRTALDSSGPALAEGVKAGPDWIKINRAEFTQCFNRPFDCLLTAARHELNPNSQGWVITDGAKGAALITANQFWQAEITQAIDDPVNTVGCGDALLAGLVVALLNEQPLKTALRQGMACALANLRQPEPGRFQENDRKSALSAVAIR